MVPIAKMRIKPYGESINEAASLIGSNAHAIRGMGKDKTAVHQNNKLFEILGIHNSLTNNLIPSVKGCNSPQPPTT